MGVLLAYCAGKLGPEAAETIERHIQACDACSAFTRGQRQVWSALDAWESAPVSQDFDARLYARVRENEERGWWAGLWTDTSWKPLAPLAAVCGIVALAFILNAPARQPMTQRNESTRIESIEPEVLERTLDDIEMLKQLGPAGQPLSL
jgi:anti-sigma factor RsiW